MNFSFDIFKLRIGCRCEIKRINHIPVYGWANRTLDGFYIPFFDYDRLTEQFIVGELKMLQQAFELSDFYLLKTEHGFHALNFDKLTLREWISVLKHTSCDYNFRSVPLTYGQIVWNLRLSAKQQKPKLVAVVRSIEQSRVKSLAHIQFFEKRFGVKVNKDNIDNQKELILCSYTS